MALTDRLMDDARVALPGATDAGIQRELWNVVNEACRDGWLWRETVSVPVVEGQLQYDLAPTGSEVIFVLNAGHETLDLTEAYVEFGKLYLTTLPTAADAAGFLIVTLVLAPAVDAPNNPEGLIPEDMWRMFHQLWLHGLLSRMMAHPAKPYSNATLAVFHRRSFTRDLAEARLQVRTGGVPGVQTWRFPAWA